MTWTSDLVSSVLLPKLRSFVHAGQTHSASLPPPPPQVWNISILVVFIFLTHTQDSWFGFFFICWFFFCFQLLFFCGIPQLYVLHTYTEYLHKYLTVTLYPLCIVPTTTMQSTIWNLNTYNSVERGDPILHSIPYNYLFTLIFALFCLNSNRYFPVHFVCNV